MTRGPRQPTGLTPASLYRRIVSWEIRARSLANRRWIALILGCSSVIFLVDCI